VKLHNELGGFQQINWLRFIYAAAEAEAWYTASLFSPLLKNELMTFADSAQLAETETSIHLLEVQLVGLESCFLSKSIMIVVQSTAFLFH